MNMNWRKKQNPIQKRGLFGDFIEVIGDVVDDIVDEQNINYDTYCSDDDNNNNDNNNNGTNSSSGNGFFGGTSNGGPDGAGPFNTDELTITIMDGTNNSIEIPFIQKTDSDSNSDSNSNSNFIHIMESTIENKDYKARFGILTPIASVNPSYSLTIYDNNRNVIVHADKISVTTPQQSQYGYQITATKNKGNTFIVYTTEKCTITIADTK